MRVTSSLKRAFTFHYIISATVPIVLFAWFSFHFANKYLVDEVFRSNAFLAHEVRTQVEDYLQLRSESLRHVASTVLASKALTFRSVESYLAEEVQSLNDFESIYILDRSGKVVHLGLSASQEMWKKDYQGVDLSGHELFQRFDRGEDPGWSDTYISLVTGEPSISLGVTYGDYMVVGNLGLRRLGQIISRFSLYDQSLSDKNKSKPLTFAIIDRKGIPIAHTNVDAVLRQRGMRFHPEIVNALSGEVGTDLYWHDNTQWIETGLPVNDTGWVVWLSRDFDQITEPVTTIKHVFFLILLVSVFAAILFGLVTARSVLRPLGELVQGVRSLAAGGVNDTTGQKSYIEIDDLSDAFRRMVKSVVVREKSLRNSESRFRSLVNSIEGIVFEANLPKIEFTFVNERSESILGYPAGEWLDNPDFWKRCIHPDDRKWAFNYSLNQAESGLNHQFEYRMLHHDGHVIWVRQMVNVVIEEGKATRLVGVMIDVTASKEAAISLQESEQRFRSLVEQAADAIFIYDAHGQLIDVNEQACRSLDYPRDELKRKILPDIQILQPPLEFTALHNSVMRGGSLTFEAEHRRKNKTLFPVEIRLGSFQYQDSPLFLALVRDVTDRKRAVTALQESEERYRTVVATMTEGVILTGSEGQIVAVNPAAERILRASSSEVIGLKVDDERWPMVRADGSLYAPEQLPAVVTRKTGEPINALVGFPGESSSIMWIEVNTQPILSFGEGRGGGVVVTMNNVTAKKTAEEALRESEGQVRLLLDSTAEGVFGLDCDQNCTFCNPAGLKLLGFINEDEVLGKNAHTLFHHSHVDGSTYPSAECPISNLYVTGQQAHSDAESFWRTDGTAFSVEYFAHPVIKDDVLAGAVVVFHDITERKLMQQQSIRTAQLASLGELAAGVAHEINNPISGVINYAQILLNRKAKSGEDTDLIARIIKEGERVATIVKDLLFFARDSGPEKSLSNIRDVLEDSLSLSAAQIRKEGILLNVIYADDLPMMNTRAQQIQQLFLNLLSNARHALNQKYPTHHENKKIDISIYSVVQGDIPYLRIVFKDYGVGISAQMLERVMHPFVTTKAAGVGTGLGLSISFDIVKKHDGNLWIESVEGESTEVFIDLPYSRKD